MLIFDGFWWHTKNTVLKYTGVCNHWEQNLEAGVDGSRSVTPDCLRPCGRYSPGILQAGTLEWLAAPFSGGSSQPRDQFLIIFYNQKQQKQAMSNLQTV